MADYLALITNVLTNPEHPIGVLFHALVVFLVALVASAVVRKVTRRIAQHPQGRLKIDETSINFLRLLLTAGVWFGAAIVFVSLIPRLQVLLSAILASAGITAIVIGLAAQNTLSNMIAGLLVSIFRPIRLRDVVFVDEEFGSVEDITLMYTVIRTWDYRRLIIPNSVITNSTLVNYSHTDPRLLLHLEVGISYDADIDRARESMLEEAARCTVASKNPPEQPYVRVVEVGEYSIVMRLYLWLDSPMDLYAARWELNEAIKKRFDAEGIEIPFPYRTIVYKKDMAA